MRGRDSSPAQLSSQSRKRVSRHTRPRRLVWLGGSMTRGRLLVRLGYSLVGVFATMTVAQAQSAQTHDHEGGAGQGALVKAVRESTERFRNVSAAEAEGYTLMFGCVSGPTSARWDFTMSNRSCWGMTQWTPQPRRS